MLLRKNTKLFKTILAIVEASQTLPDREKLIRLFITKVGESVDKRLALDGIVGDAGVFYEMTYQTVLNNLRSSNHQLYENDEEPGVYFFHSSNKAWDETPFEFDEAIKEEFASLSELPNVRKKGKAGKVVLPTSKTRPESKPARKEKTTKAKAKRPAAPKPQQHYYNLRKEIDFNNLDKIVYRQPHFTRKDVLDYYDKVANAILPYLKDRPLMIIAPSDSGRPKEYATLEKLSDTYEELPDWLQTFQTSKSDDRLILCNDKEHLMFYASLGCVQFNCSPGRTKSITTPDYVVIVLNTDAESSGLIEATQTAQTILKGLKVPSFVKTDGASGLHLYIPLDAKSKIDPVSQVAAYLCKLIRLKSPDRISLSGSEDYTYGKIALDYYLNSESATAIAPYSLFAGETASVASPLNWDEVQESFRFDELTPDAVLKRLKREGDAFESLFRKKVNGDELLERLEAGYSFLL